MEIKTKQPTQKQAEYIADNFAMTSNGKAEKRVLNFVFVFFVAGAIALALTFFVFSGLAQGGAFVVSVVLSCFGIDKFKDYRLVKNVTKKMKEAVEKNEVTYFNIRPQAAAVVWYDNKEDAVFLFELEDGKLLSLIYPNASSLKNFPNTDFDYTWLGSGNYFLFADIEMKGQYLAPVKEISIKDIMKLNSLKQYNEIMPNPSTFYKISNASIKDIIK
ncbi:hypothetical protein Dip510_000975 [Elusimicrobium posterum]|uniref:hypothetical protein n=1 Tax=Elusimicrobium posterum TaxID=3116653 RepID=UPI003C75F9CD